MQTGKEENDTLTITKQSICGAQVHNYKRFLSLKCTFVAIKCRIKIGQSQFT